MLGNATNRRRLVDADAAFAAYAECAEKAEVSREAYLSAFTFDEDFRQHLKATGSTRDFDGYCSTPWLWFDLDGEDLDVTLSDARRLAVGILHRYRSLDDDALLLFFSGSKGLMSGCLFLGPGAVRHFPPDGRRFAEGIAAEVGVNIDTGVYDKVRLFRAPNSRHPKTGLHKRRLSLDELLPLDAARVRHLAAAPEPFGLPVVTAADLTAAADWQAAMQAVEGEAEAKAERRDCPRRTGSCD